MKATLFFVAPAAFVATLTLSARQRPDEMALTVAHDAVRAITPAAVHRDADAVVTLVARGKELFATNWMARQGGARPMTRGTGRPLAEGSESLTGARAFNRVSAPDANSCAGCHNAPHGIVGGGGDFVTSVFVLAQRFDFATFDPADTLPTRGAVDEKGRPATLQDVGNLRATTGMFGGRLPGDARPADDDRAAAHPRLDPLWRIEGAGGQGRALRGGYGSA